MRDKIIINPFADNLKIIVKDLVNGELTQVEKREYTNIIVDDGFDILTALLSGSFPAGVTSGHIDKLSLGSGHHLAGDINTAVQFTSSETELEALSLDLDFSSVSSLKNTGQVIFIARIPSSDSGGFPFFTEIGLKSSGLGKYFALKAFPAVVAGGSRELIFEWSIQFSRVTGV